jgi:hypothetical protein
MTMSPLRVGAVLAAATLGAALLTAGAAAPESAEAPTIARDVSVDTRQRLVGESALRAFMASDTPKSITIDVDSNQITSISDSVNMSERAMTTVCKSGQMCWHTAQVPYTNLGFGPAGTHTGTWHKRGKLSSNNYAGQVWYVRTATPDRLLTSGAFPKNTNITFTGSGITGKKVTAR